MDHSKLQTQVPTGHIYRPKKLCKTPKGVGGLTTFHLWTLGGSHMKGGWDGDGLGLG